MAICYFDRDYETRYQCSFVEENGTITVDVDYAIESEIESTNGLIIFSANIEFKQRDILICDHDSKQNILIKNAYYAGHQNVYALDDYRNRTRFQGSIYFKNKNADALRELKESPKIKKIKIFSKAINDLIGNPSLNITQGEPVIFQLSNKDIEKSITIDKNNIATVTVGEEYKWEKSFQNSSLAVDFIGYLTIELKRRDDYLKIAEYINELMIYVQLYYPDKFSISKLNVEVDGEDYEFYQNHLNLKHNEKRVERVVSDELLIFLKTCYTKISYRKTSEQYRNIPYIVCSTSRGLEDNFLMFYRFIECYGKRKNISGLESKFMTYAFDNYCKDENTDAIECCREVISLRNQYVHSGYFIKNGVLKIRADEENGLLARTENQVDINWIYERTKILYKICIEIIYNEMLGYKSYKFKRHF